MSTLPSVVLGSQLLGLAFNWSLQGILSVQVYIYYLCFPKDTVAIKLLVYAMCIHEWMQTALATYSVFQSLRVHRFVESVFVTANVGWVVMFIMPAFTAASVQSFYAWRIYILSQNRKVFPTVILGCVVGALCAGIIGAVNLQRMTPNDLSMSSDEAVVWDVATNIWLWGSIMIDAMIAGFMIHTLQRFRTLQKDTNLLVNRLIKLVIETGSATVVGATITLVFWLAIPHTLLATLPLLILSKLYANTLMVTLNNRAFMHAQALDGDIRRSPLILHMTSRHSDRCTRSNAAEIGTCRPVEVTLPPATDADEYPSEPTKQL